MSPGPFTRLPGTPSDQRLLASARDGDERAFETVVRRHIRALLRYCRRMGLSDSRAEDVVQQALLQAWLALQRGREVRSPKAWLYRTVHNTAVNMIRASRDDHAQLEDGTLVDHVASVESDFERRLAVRQALSDVAALPQMQRDAILLTAFEGRSHEDVASALGVTHGAVRGLLYRARATLRDTAAAVVPAPLLAWLGACLARVAPAATRLAELSPGGGDMGGALAKGVALAGSAAVLAVGTGVVPVGRPAHGSKTPVLALGIGGAGAGAVTSNAASVPTLPTTLRSPGRIESSANTRARENSGHRHRRHDGAAGSSGRRVRGGGDERRISDDPLRLGSREGSRSGGDAILGSDGGKSGSSTASGSGRDGSPSSGISGSDGSHDGSPRPPGSDGSPAVIGAEAPPPEPRATSDDRGRRSGSGDGGSGKSPEPIVAEPSK